MRLSVLLLAVWFLLATTSCAHADPVTAIVGIISAVAKIGTIGQLVLGVALKVGASLLSRARGKREDQRPAGVKGSMTVGGDNPMSFIIGTYATAGQLEYVNSYGKAGKTPNAYLVQVVSLSDLPVSAMSSAVWINGEKCTIDWNAAPTDAGYPVLQYRQNGTDHLWVRFRDGTQTAVDPYLLSTFGADASRPWLADMIGRGVAYAIVTARVNREVMTSPPRCKFVLQGIKLYDIRKDTTAGGSGSHRWADPSTWEWSDNTKVAQYNLLRGLSYNGDWFYGGQNLAAFQLPASNWMAAMNECDRLVAVAAGGTEKQFRCGAEIALNYQPIEAIKELDKSCNGRTAELGGIYKTICGMPGLPVYSFGDEDIVITSEQQQDPFPAHEQTYNGAHASYPEPAEDWTNKDAPPRYNATYEAADDGQRLIADLSYPMVPYGTQVQRLMYAAIEEERRFIRHTGTLPPEAWLLEPLDAIAWTSARNGYDAKMFLIGDMDDLPGVNQVVAFRELDPLDYSWSSDRELPVSVGPTGPIVPPPQAMTGWAVGPAEVPDATGAARRPGIRIGCAADLEDVARIHVTVRLKATGAVVFDSDQTPYPRPGTNATYDWILSGAWCLPATLYQAQGRYVPFSTRETEASAWLDVMTPNILSTDVSVGLGEVREDVKSRFEELQGEFDNVWTRVEELTAAFSLEGAVGEIKRQELKASVGDALAQIIEERRVRASDDEAMAQLYTALTATVGSNLARLITEETARATADSAMASSITSLDAEVDGNLARLISEEQARATADSALSSSITGVSADLNGRFAGGLVKFEAAADQSGVNARFSVMLRATLNDAFKDSGFYIEIYTEGGVLKSRFAVKADQFVVWNGGSNAFLPIVIENGELKSNIANIGLVRAGRMLSPNNKVDFNLNAGTLEFYS
ncbi:phage tail protein [Ensifer adhaerens]|uniref:Phage tail protein n=1 Tax=Ensifer adhaerens TaxID=106592 RepID=A0A9Q8YBT1_ENSAD|nr:phage tail protein [Ensifer adhaerens]USJ24734.1 phage tail protein [Ensifer adhaerens]